MNTEYKVIPFADVKIGQEFEDAEAHYSFSDSPWLKAAPASYTLKNKDKWDSKTHPKIYCLVRVYDCEPELANIDNPASKVDMTIVRVDGSVENAQGSFEGGEITMKVKQFNKIHYPECWDTMAYPTLESAISEFGGAKCDLGSACVHYKPELDFDTWWKRAQAIAKSIDGLDEPPEGTKERCKAAWDAARATNTEPAE
jgi:hypothetical protein